MAAVRVTAGTGGIDGWRVTLPLPAGTSVVNSWNGQFSANSGTIQVTNVSYNGRLVAGTSTEFGFQANGSVPSPALTCVAL